MSDDADKPQMSHAKSVNLEYQDQNKLDQASRNLRAQFERAKVAQLEQKKAQPAPDMSYARTQDTEPSNDKLSQASQKLRDQFARAQAGKQQNADRQNGVPDPQTQQGSDMVRKDQPTMQPKPPQEIRNDPDRQSYNDRLAQERQRAAEMNEAAKARIKQQKQLELDNDRDKNNDDRGR
jgi:hypothetical protein